ncbi:hypothetical protein REPUB_Repub17cG0018000 [Reevesia pubescens]
MENDCISAEVKKLVVELPNKGVLLLENVRFYNEEKKNDPEFVKKVASLTDVYVNDAFGTAHRAYASIKGVAKFLKPYMASCLMQKKLDYLVGAVANPKKPFAAIVGGFKFADDANCKVVLASQIPDGGIGLDIGSDSIKTFSEALDTTKTINWNGPMVSLSLRSLLRALR